MPAQVPVTAEPITVFTFVLELPRLVPVNENASLVMMAEPTAGWEHWTADACSALLGSDEMIFNDATVPGTRMVFRRAEVWNTPPLYGADLAFADWVEPLLDEAAIEQRNRTLELARDHGMPMHLSAVALSRFIPRPEHPRGEAMTRGWLLGAFREALRELNELLDFLGFVARDGTVSALSDRDLPAMLPVIVQSSHASDVGEPEGITTVIGLHDRWPTVKPQEYPNELLATAVWIRRTSRDGEQPFGELFRFIHTATAQLVAGETSRAVTELATAVEILVATLLREGPPRLKWSEEQTRTTLNTLDAHNLANAVQHHVARVLGEEIDLTRAGAGPWREWWERGYHARNAALHEGRRLTDSDADYAFRAAAALFEHVKKRLLAQEPLSELGELMLVDIQPPDPDKEPLGWSFPWDART